MKIAALRGDWWLQNERRMLRRESRHSEWEISCRLNLTLCLEWRTNQNSIIAGDGQWSMQSPAGTQKPSSSFCTLLRWTFHWISRSNVNILRLSMENLLAKSVQTRINFSFSPAENRRQGRENDWVTRVRFFQASNQIYGYQLHSHLDSTSMAMASE